ncbi:hypothetical protein CC86DRAFT_386441 [Ophiobolus disseminans]|uniref:Uncharacterized protein n=1 Tax=Ophiobolus disseminans TaxID=1469910 RepID=A0A6A6ZKB5_9PLEO|nr:hypothetical protein CC86DRAFT_386441 [Ophiobolus disseminans]
MHLHILPLLALAPLLALGVSLLSQSTSGGHRAVDARQLMPSTNHCWKSQECNTTLNNFIDCFDHMPPGFEDPNGGVAQIASFRPCLCNTDYKDILKHFEQEMRTSVLNCFYCLKDNGVDIIDSNKATAQFRNKIYGFCNANISNVVDLLMSLIKFTKDAGMPGGLPERVVAVTKIASKLSSTLGMNSPTSTAAKSTDALGPSLPPRTPEPSTSSTPATSKPSTDFCWHTDECSSITEKFTSCLVGQVIDDPNHIENASMNYQKCLCTDDFLYILPVPASNSSIAGCYGCLYQAGVDVNNDETPSRHFVYRIWGFCNSAKPNMFGMFMDLVDFSTDVKKPESLMPERIQRMTSLRLIFTSSTNMNAPSTMPLFPTKSWPFTAQVTPKSTPQHPGSDPNVPWYSSTLTSGSPIPTEYLAQLPLRWPYTEYGIQRKAGKTTSWPLVNPNSTTQTVAWVYATVLWNQRPLYTPPAEKAKRKADVHAPLYNPDLNGWKHEFIYETLTPSAPTSSVTPLPTPAPSSPTDSISTTQSGAKPTITQQSVLGKDPDNKDESAYKSTFTKNGVRLMAGNVSALQTPTPGRADELSKLAA